jgi:hypothetical protein
VYFSMFMKIVSVPSPARLAAPDQPEVTGLPDEASPTRLDMGTGILRLKAI